MEIHKSPNCQSNPEKKRAIPTSNNSREIVTNDSGTEQIFLWTVLKRRTTHGQ
jgi:hypothetical protein